MTLRSLRWTLGIFATAACAAHPPPVVVRPPPVAAIRVAAPPPAWTYWVPVEIDVPLGAAAPPLPLDEAQIGREGAIGAAWDALPDAAREGVRRRAFAVVTPGDDAAPSVVPAAARARFGAYYTELARARVPALVTVDALFGVAETAIARALVDVDREIGASLETLLGRLDLRLGTDARGASADLAAAYRVARGVVAVARALALDAPDARGAAPPADLAAVVKDEVASVMAHAAIAPSPLLGAPIDYAAMAPHGDAARSEAALRHGRALAWLEAATLYLGGRGEMPGSPVDIAQARTDARAALLLARLVAFDVDAEASHAWGRIAALRRFVAAVGTSRTTATTATTSAATADAPPDPCRAGCIGEGLSPPDFAAVARRAGIDPHDVRAIANVARLDRARHAVIDAASPGIGDRIDGAAVRLVAALAPPDATAMARLVAPFVGALTSETAPATAREGEGAPGTPGGDADAGTDRAAGPTSPAAARALPSALDVAAWLGSPAARAALHAAGDDAYDGYDAALVGLADVWPADLAVRHASLYVSTLDAIGTWLAPSVADATQAFAADPAWRLRRVEGALGAWTRLRHDARPFVRAGAAATPSGKPAPSVAPMATIPDENAAIRARDRDGAADAPAVVFVEAHPEAIAQLVALVRQAARGLEALGVVRAGSAVAADLARAEHTLDVALHAALREAAGETPSPEGARDVAALPAEIDAVERAAIAAGADPVLAIADDVFVDAAPGRALEETVGPLDDAYVAVVDHATSRVVLAVGAVAPHRELVQPAALRLDDAAWRARLAAGTAPPRDPFAAAYVVVASSTAPRAP